jgi:hypothetical protein
MVEPKVVEKGVTGGLDGDDIWGDDHEDPLDEFAKMTDEELKT